LHLPAFQILWALVINAPDLAAFLTFHIFSTPGLVSQIRAELSKHVKIAPGTTIGKFSSPPTLEISHQGLATQSPLFKSAYQEALRLYSAPWSVRAVKQDAIISNGKGGPEYRLHKGNNIILPHEVHMLNPRHFPQPEQFIADRFLKPDSSDEGEGEGKKDVGQDVFDPGMIRPYGGGMSMCKGRTYAEREILSIVAGVVMMWDFEPVVNEKGRKEWKLPLVERASGVAKPRGEVRVRIKKRGFEREEN
jgi:cytochrome P450